MQSRSLIFMTQKISQLDLILLSKLHTLKQQLLLIDQNHIVVYFLRGKHLQTHQECFKSLEIIQLNFRWNPKIIEKLLVLYQNRFIQMFIHLKNYSFSIQSDIFSIQENIRNDQKFINCDTQKQFVDICDELRQQIEIEMNDLIQSQLELYLFLTKTSFQISPNDGKERDDIL
ncbi:unnamed protein product [Paramecium primaurelia]|uniref:Uncharacterized protein n=1 Tax=Paramecium primaurelia TaxID=5886 RepID=A0A8S1NG98_PARPR|nr:unnamed protein product [Paramecium primaurelia]